ncbi:protein ecdysoneless homolog isoform X1, partial [Tanacetum coccineum]
VKEGGNSEVALEDWNCEILRNEWNSSPVRMAKDDRRRLKKHRGWRHTHKAYTGHS